MKLTSALKLQPKTFVPLPSSRPALGMCSPGKSYNIRLLAAGLMFCILAFCTPAMTAQYADLFEFTTGNGSYPQWPAVMAQGRDGNLYGTAPTGGSSNVGVVFKLTPAGTQTVIYNFDVTHGSTPNGGLTLGVDGNLYGTAEFGGANAYGNIFKITPAGVLTVLYNFTGDADGGYPVAPLILGTDGNFYGTSYPGSAFKISATGVFTRIATIPTVSYGPLLQASDGNFYGVTEFGGTSSAGTVYKVAGKKVTTLFSFDGLHGSYPIGGLVQAADGYLYGTTTAGGADNAGVIYKISTSGVLTVVVSFDSVHPLGGYQMYGGLVAANDGNLYGATIWGGTNGDGVFFQLTTGGVYTVLYNFLATTGAGAYSTPMQDTSGTFFGLTKRGGALGEGVGYSVGAGVEPFVLPVSTLGPVGKTIGILGGGLKSTTSVAFNGMAASFKVVSDTYLTAKVPAGETGIIAVNTSSGILFSSKIFRVTPKILSFSPVSGAVGSTVTITGSGLIQAVNITVGGVRVTSYTVNSDAELTFTVLAGAKTGAIAVTTPGGAASKKTFTVTP